METMNLSLAVEEGAELAGLECALNEIERVRRCVCVCVCVCEYMYVYVDIYIHTHIYADTYTQTGAGMV